MFIKALSPLSNPNLNRLAPHPPADLPTTADAIEAANYVKAVERANAE